MSNEHMTVSRVVLNDPIVHTYQKIVDGVNFEIKVTILELIIVDHDNDDARTTIVPTKWMTAFRPDGGVFQKTRKFARCKCFGFVFEDNQYARFVLCPSCGTLCTKC